MGLIKFSSVFLLITINTISAINLGLIAGDLKRHAAPLTIRKHSRYAPMIINIRGSPRPPAPLRAALLTRIKPPKPPPKRTPRMIPKPLFSLPPPLFLPKILPIIPPPILLPPLIPRLPVIPKLPILPKITLIPRIPVFPLFPRPLIPKPLFPLIPTLSLLKLKSPLKPLKLPALTKPLINEGILSKCKPVRALPINAKNAIFKKMLQLRRDGELSNTDYFKFRKVLF